MKVQSWPQYSEEATTYTLDWGVKAGVIGANVSAVLWSVEGGSASISSEALASNVASALITTNTTGCVLIKAKATLGTQTDVHFFKIKVSDPANDQSLKMY